MFNAMRDELNAGGTQGGALLKVLKDASGVKGSQKLFDGEVKYVRFYTDAPDAIKTSGKIVGTDGKAYFSLQSFETGSEAQQLLAVDHTLTHYVDIPVSKLQGKIEIVRTVEPKSNLLGEGLEIVTKEGVDVSDIISDLDFKLLKQE